MRPPALRALRRRLAELRYCLRRAPGTPQGYGWAPSADKFKTQKGRNAGAAEASAAATRGAEVDLRNQQAELAGLPEDLRLTKGQATQDRKVQADEQTLANSPGGEALKERVREQNIAIQDGIDDTAYNIGRYDDGEYVPYDSHTVGERVRDSLDNYRTTRKAEVDDAYTAARASDEATLPAYTKPIDEVWNSTEFQDFKYLDGSNQTMPQMEKYLVEKGFAEVVDGKLSFKDLNVGQVEEIRQRLGGFVDEDKPQTGRMVRQMTDAIDGALDQSDGGELFKRARAARREFAVDFDEHQFVDQLLGKKGKYSDAKIAPADVGRRVITMSRDQISRVRDLLKKQGPEGGKAWRDLQSGVLRDLSQEVRSTVQSGPDGRNLNITPLIRKIDSLEAESKLEDFVW